SETSSVESKHRNSFNGVRALKNLELSIIVDSGYSGGSGYADGGGRGCNKEEALMSWTSKEE
ncbi:hypothetical protein HAX54_014557, partial [Datura stramonium]|nr:hypothetical protein [Datura stramonium]